MTSTEPNQPSDKTLREFRRQAEYLTARITGQYQASRVKSWVDIENMFGIRIPPPYCDKDFNYANLSLFNSFWISSYKIRLSIPEAAEEPKRLSLVPQSQCTTFGKVTLRPHQEPVYRAIDAAFRAGQRAILQDGEMGEGKTYVACGRLAKLVADGVLNDPALSFRLHPFIIFCPKQIAVKWHRTLVEFGLGHLLENRKILIFEATAFNNFAGKTFFEEVEDEITHETVVVMKPYMVPYQVIIDECQGFVHKSSYRTKCIEALGASAAEFILFMSATPFECVNDSRIVVMASRFVYQGMRVTKTNFDIFAKAHDEDPGKPNQAAMKRLRATLSPIIISMPPHKRAHKAVRVIQLVDFEKAEHVNIYNTIIERYYEVCRKVGKNPDAAGQFKKAVALAKLRVGVEPMRAWWSAQRAASNYHRQVSTIIMPAFKETVATVMFKLVELHNIPRREISVIWGGRRDVKSGDIIAPEALSTFLTTITQEKLNSDPDLFKKLKMTLKFREDQMNHGESFAEQEFRMTKLREYGLAGVQSQESRQRELDKFLITGETRICIATIDTGGVGLDLDRKYEHIWRRESHFTQIYSGRKFLQAMGRDVREDSISDSLQLMIMLRNTVEEKHVAPRLDAKLRSNAAFTNRTFDIVPYLEELNAPQETKISTVEEMSTIIDTQGPQAIRPAETDEDETDNLDEMVGM